MDDEWVAVDFETASIRGTPCQVGAVRYRNGAEVDAFETLIHQPRDSFWELNVALHGITPADVVDAPHWPEARDRLLEFVSGTVVVAHNAAFDVGVIRDASDLCDLEWPTLDYACTYRLARHLWPGQGSYSLMLLCASLGICDDFSHVHEALADARLAAAVLNRALVEASAASLSEVLDRSRIVFGRLAPDGWFGCHVRALSAASIVPNAAADQESPFYGKHVAFTGELAMVRRDAQHSVADAGGIPQDGVTKATDFLVCGYQDAYKLASGETKSHKLRRAEDLRAAGQPIEIIIERDFFRMLHQVGAAAQSMQPA